MSALVAFDSETRLIEPGLLAPPGVCGSFYDGGEGWLETFPDALEELEAILRPGVTLAGANIAYDFAVATGLAKGGRWQGRPDLLPLIFAKYARGEVFDVQIALALHAVAGGHLFKDPFTFGAMRASPEAKVWHRYSLECCTYYLTGRTNAKANDEWRLRYAELENTPIAEWPEAARIYPVDDARNTYDCAAALRGPTFQNQGKLQRHDWTHQTHNARAAFAMHLMSTWGFRTDPDRVAALSAEVEANHAKNVEAMRVAGILGADGKKDNAKIKERVILAYGGSLEARCLKCHGSGKTVSEISGNEINCKVCSATGLDLPAGMPCTPTGGVKADRDTLSESGNGILEELAEMGQNEKIRETYIPFLNRGVQWPINISGNVLVDTGRASFEGLLQTMPKGGGVRECVVSRPGTVLCSVDFNALELSTLAQVCLWTVGFSRLAESINSGMDQHCALAAQMTQQSYEAIKAAVDAEIKAAVDARFCAKAGNFGFGGLMGAAKFAFTQRKAKIGGHGSMCRLGGCEERPCGSEKIYEWKGRPCPPICRQCVEFSEVLRKAWLQTWEEMPAYFKWVLGIEGVSEGHGRIVSPGTGYVRSGLNASAAANHSFQHLAAYGAKHALWNVCNEAYNVPSSALYGSRPIIFAHDEIIAEVPEGQAHEAGYRLAEVMISSMREFVPDVRISAEPALMRRLYKAAKTVKDPQGRLVCWEPKAATP